MDFKGKPDLGFFILFDHFKEAVHGLLDRFGIDEPFYDMS